MPFNPTDIFLILIFAISISIIMGLSIVSVIDKKISNVSVNIPAPQVQVMYNPNNQDISNIVPVNEIENPILQNSSPIQQDSNEQKNIENFIVSDANEFQNYKKLRTSAVKKPDNFYQEILQNDVLVGSNEAQSYGIKNKDALKNNYITSTDFGFEPPKYYKSCSNGTIPHKPKVTHINKKSKCSTCNKYKCCNNCNKCNECNKEKSCVACERVCKMDDLGVSAQHPKIPEFDMPNKLTAENYYRTTVLHQAIPIEDYHIRAANYNEYTDTVSPYNIKYMRILSQNTKGLPPSKTENKHIPVGHNYAFHNLPVAPLP